MASVRSVQSLMRYGYRWRIYNNVSVITNQYRYLSSEAKPIPKQAGEKPKIIELGKDESIWWCSCGYSNDQPCCDGSHETENTGMEPIEFIASETKKYAFCTCKLSKKAPLCDGMLY